MKTSNLIGLLAIGGAGYYLLTRQKKQMLVSAPITSAPITSTPITSTPITSTPITSASAIVSNSKTETALAPLAIQTTVVPTTTAPIAPIAPITPITPITYIITPPTTTSTLIAPTTSATVVPTTKIETALAPLGITTGCILPIDGWDKNIVSFYMNYSGYTNIAKLINDPQLKEKDEAYVDSCGNIYLKEWQYLVKSTTSKKPDGFYHGVIQRYSGYSSNKEISYYIKNNILYLLPFQLIQEYRNKYLIPISAYLKKLPKMDLSEKNFTYPENGQWKNVPDMLYNYHPLFDRQMETIINNPSRDYEVINTQFLVKNPSVRNKNGFYVDQFGNIIDLSRGANGTAMASAHSIAEYRVNHGIPF